VTVAVFDTAAVQHTADSQTWGLWWGSGFTEWHGLVHSWALGTCSPFGQTGTCTNEHAAAAGLPSWQ